MTNSKFDLRSSEFIASQRFFKPRLIKVIAVVLCAYILAGIIFWLNIYADLLQADIQTERAALQVLSLEAEQLKDLLEEAASLESKAVLVNTFHNTGLLPSQLLQISFENSLLTGVTPVLIASDHNNGTLLIEGISTDMQQITQFNQSFAGLPVLSAAVITSIEMNAEGLFRFQLKGAIEEHRKEKLDE